MALWGQSPTSTPTVTIPACTPFELPSGGALVFNSSYTSTLTAKIVFQQPCDDPGDPSNTKPGASGNSTIIGLRDPFYASTSPQIFAIATATVISYLLVIIIFITPRTIFVGGLGGASNSGILGRSASTSVVGVGRRPWLQKIATVTVAISLTIATAHTFRVAQEQYNRGYADAGLLVDDVVGSLEIKIVRLISDTFLWLAQVQTLIRLFPRHREKVTIKWLGFALVSLDTIFSILDDFVNQGPRTRPRSFQDAIPALNYLFELAISLIYASCVIYYSLSKRRFAFWHHRMRNICLVALLSLIAVLIPVVFFVLDVSKPDVAGWGDYIRWVGAAAASVVVWEWVERIEALERDERKDGILGREIFDGDEMLDGPAVEEAGFPDRRQYWNRNGFPSDPSESGAGGTGGMRMRALRSRINLASRLRGGDVSAVTDGHPEIPGMIVLTELREHPTIRPQAVSPVSRSDTTSAGSTIYAIHYHAVQTPPANDSNEIAAQIPPPGGGTAVEENSIPSSSETAAEVGAQIVKKDLGPVNADAIANTEQDGKTAIRSIPVWRTVPNPFKRRRASPPAEVAAQIAESGTRRTPAERTMALHERFTSVRWNRLRGASSRGSTDVGQMEVTVIPARPRGHRTWSPLQNTEQEPRPDGDAQEQQEQAQAQRRQISKPPLRSPTSNSSAQHQDDRELPVLVIPAPRRGQRTWSPEDAYTGPVIQSPIPSPAPDPDPPPDGASTRFPVVSTRGTLTISEDQVRGQTAPNRRSTYTRNSATYASAGSSSTSRSTTPTAASNLGFDRMVQESARPPESDSSKPSQTSDVQQSAPTEKDNRT